MTRRLRSMPVAGLVVGAVLACGCAYAAHQGPPRVDRGTVPSAAPGPVQSAVPAATPAPVLGAQPTRVQLAGLGVSAPVSAVDVASGGALGVPKDPLTVGWWRGGAAAGASQGTVVLDGHVDSAATGRGALFTLEQVPVGSQVVLTTSRSSVRYRITGVRSYAKAALPPQVFSRTGSPRLALVTCGGPFNRGTRHYRDNVVAYAVPVSPPVLG